MDTSTSMNHNSGRDVARAPALRAPPGPSFAPETHEVGPETLRATGDGVGVTRRVIDHRDVESPQGLQKLTERINVVANRNDDVDVVGVRSRPIQRMQESLLHERARESLFTDLDDVAVHPPFGHRSRAARQPKESPR